MDFKTERSVRIVHEFCSIIDSGNDNEDKCCWDEDTGAVDDNVDAVDDDDDDGDDDDDNVDFEGVTEDDRLDHAFIVLSFAWYFFLSLLDAFRSACIRR